jgi:hypothetical protein
MRQAPIVMHGCGHTGRSWKARPLCNKCLRKQERPTESLRAFRQRLKGSGE